MTLDDLVRKAAEHGVSSIESARGPLIPFTFILDANPDLRERTLKLTRHVSEELSVALQLAQLSITPDSNCSMYAIAWDGYVTFEGRKWDAVLIEAGESSAAEGAIFAQRYELKERGLFTKSRCNVAVGKPISMQSSRSRLWGGTHA